MADLKKYFCLFVRPTLNKVHKLLTTFKTDVFLMKQFVLASSVCKKREIGLIMILLIRKIAKYRPLRNLLE